MPQRLGFHILIMFWFGVFPCGIHLESIRGSSYISTLWLLIFALWEWRGLSLWKPLGNQVSKTWFHKGVIQNSKVIDTLSTLTPPLSLTLSTAQSPLSRTLSTLTQSPFSLSLHFHEPPLLFYPILILHQISFPQVIRFLNACFVLWVWFFFPFFFCFVLFSVRGLNCWYQENFKFLSWTLFWERAKLIVLHWWC